MNNTKLTVEHIEYVEMLSRQLIIALREVLITKDSPERARFNRLRVELGKMLLDISKVIYRSW